MHIQRFNFSDLQDFRHPPVPQDEPEDIIVEEEEEAPPPPMFSLGDLESAKMVATEEGRKAGFQEGVQKAKDEDSQRLLHIEEVCEKVVVQATELNEQFRQFVGEQKFAISTLVLMIARKVAGDIVNAVPTSSIEAMIDECLNVLITQPKVTLTVHPDLGNQVSEILRNKLESLGSHAQLSVVADGNFEPSEGRLEWKDGAIERDVDAIWDAIANKLAAIDFSESLDLPAPAPVTSIDTASPPPADTGEDGPVIELESPEDNAEEITADEAETTADIGEDAPVIEMEASNDEKIGENETLEHTNAQENDSVTTVKTDESSDKGDES